MIHVITSEHHQMSSPSFFQGLRLTLGDMYTKQVPENHKNGTESGPGGSVWAQTLSERRPEAQDHFPSPPGPQKQINKIKDTYNYQNLECYCQKKNNQYLQLFLYSPPAALRQFCCIWPTVGRAVEAGRLRMCWAPPSPGTPHRWSALLCIAM